MSKHTPGPWKHVGQTGDGKRQLVESANDDSWERCSAEIDSDDCDHDMAIANARLIAAAPELLDALEGLLDARDTDWEEAAEGDPDSDEGKAWLSAVKQAYEAVRKAQGR